MNEVTTQQSFASTLSLQAKERLCKAGKNVIDAEAKAIQSLTQKLDHSFADACGYMLACEGRVIVTGMGKSGHIGNKIAATLASTGTPAFFVHPGEASHGDLGMFTEDDVVIALSNSGQTEELIAIIPLIKRLGCPLISLTGDDRSALAKLSTVHINTGVDKEACPMNLAPTSSTTATLAIGDALALALLEFKGFTSEDFARSHPGGKLGKTLLLTIQDIMVTGDAIPFVNEDALLQEALLEMTKKSLGMTAIVDDSFQPIGIFTDGDLRRALEANIKIKTTPIADVMTRNCKSIQHDQLAASALKLMETHQINDLIVTNQVNKLVGALNMHTLLKAGIV